MLCNGQVSIVAFFAVPPNVINRDNISSDDEISKFMRLFKRFINIPETETDRLAAWGIREVVHAIVAASYLLVISMMLIDIAFAGAFSCRRG